MKQIDLLESAHEAPASNGIEGQGAPCHGAYQEECAIRQIESGEDVASTKPSVDEVRRYFPCNREDALFFLGSLCISDYFPIKSVRLPLQPEGIALISSGLRRSEAELLQAGQPQRFPILVEVNPEVALRVPRIIGYGDIISLTFRTQSEADDFKFRPVDEFDTETFQCCVDENLFDHEGDPRFSTDATGNDSKLSIGRFADRLSAGVFCLMLLGESKPICRLPAACFLNGTMHETLGSEELDFIATCEILLGGRSGISRSKHQTSVVSAFAAYSGTGPHPLIDDVLKQNLSCDPPIEGSSHQIEAWANFARDVIAGRVALNGDHLSDDKSVILRGALLGVVTDKVDALTTFLDAEKPSGPKVTTEAAFLVGLKQGLLNTSWKDKKDYLQLLSPLARIIISALADTTPAFDKIFSVSTNETDSTSTVVISSPGIILAEWSEKKEFVLDDFFVEWRKELDQLEYVITGRGRSKNSCVVRLSSGLSVEITHCFSDEIEFLTLKFYFSDDQKLKKIKDLNAAFSDAGMFWYPHWDEAKQAYLSCDLPSQPDTREWGLIARKLTEAIDICVIPKKAPRGRKKMSTSQSEK